MRWIIQAATTGLLSILFVSLPVSGSATASEFRSSPEQVVDQLQTGLVDLFQGGIPTDSRTVSAVEWLLGETLDLPAFARRSIGRQAYDRMPPDKQAEYLDLFTRFMVLSQTRRIESLAGATFTVNGIQDGSNGERILRSVLKTASGDLATISYRVVETSDGWRVTDLLFDDAISEIALRRAEFGGILRDGGIAALKERLVEKIRQLELGIEP